MGCLARVDPKTTISAVRKRVGKAQPDPGAGQFPAAALCRFSLSISLKEARVSGAISARVFSLRRPSTLRNVLAEYVFKHRNCSLDRRRNSIRISNAHDGYTTSRTEVKIFLVTRCHVLLTAEHIT
jgi:hypothetical protein